MTTFRRLIPAALLCAGAAQAQAEAGARIQSFEDVAALDVTLAAALGAGVGAPGGALRGIDRRLKLAACPTPATIEPPTLNAVTVRCEARGWRIRVPLAAAAAAARAVAEKRTPIVRKGDQVELVAAAAGFSVSTIGIAEQDGGAGDRIRIRPERKGPPVIGIVGEDGSVSLPGFK